MITNVPGLTLSRHAAMLSPSLGRVFSLWALWGFRAVVAAPSNGTNSKPPAFFLAGDSMTAVQSYNGGGYGVGFLSFLKSPAWGIDYGQNGATTVSFVAGGNWSDVISSVEGSVGDYDPFVTIMVSTLNNRGEARYWG